VTESEAIARVVAGLPAGARDYLRDVAFELGDHPSAIDLGRGATPGHVGYFWGTRPQDDDGEGDPGVLPPADDRPRGVIKLFRANIAPMTFERLRAAILHEVAHALGHDEEEIRAVLGYTLEC